MATMIPSVVTAEFVAESGNISTVISEAKNLGRKFEEDLWAAGFEANINDEELQRAIGVAAGKAFEESSKVLDEKSQKAYDISQGLVPVDTSALKQSGAIFQDPSFAPKGRGSKLRGRSGRFVEMNTRSNPLRYVLAYGATGELDIGQDPPMPIPDIRAIAMELGIVHYKSGEFIQRSYLRPAIERASR